MILSVTGSRKLNDEKRVCKLISSVLLESGWPRPQGVISGGAWGVDQAVEYWAKVHNIPFKEIKADWEQYGKAAGAIRNRILADTCSHAIMFSLDDSSGTKNMIKHIKALDKPHVVIYFKNKKFHYIDSEHYGFELES